MGTWDLYYNSLQVSLYVLHMYILLWMADREKCSYFNKFNAKIIISKLKLPKMH